MLSKTPGENDDCHKSEMPIGKAAYSVKGANAVLHIPAQQKLADARCEKLRALYRHLIDFSR